jgi:hypothetical protein
MTRSSGLSHSLFPNGDTDPVAYTTMILLHQSATPPVRLSSPDYDSVKV